MEYFNISNDEILQELKTQLGAQHVFPYSINAAYVWRRKEIHFYYGKNIMPPLEVISGEDLLIDGAGNPIHPLLVFPAHQVFQTDNKDSWVQFGTFDLENNTFQITDVDEAEITLVSTRRLDCINEHENLSQEWFKRSNSCNANLYAASATYQGYFWEFMIVPMGVDPWMDLDEEGQIRFLLKESIHERDNILLKEKINMRQLLEDKIQAIISDYEEQRTDAKRYWKQQYGILQGKCNELNSRLERVRTTPGFGDTSMFSIRHDACIVNCAAMLIANDNQEKAMTIDQAQNRVQNLEYCAKQYSKYYPQFEQLRQHIEDDLEGVLDTSSTERVTLYLPKSDLKSEESSMQASQFTYSKLGLAECRTALKARMDLIRKTETYTGF